jgi:hypothetical protein
VAPRTPACCSTAASARLDVYQNQVRAGPLGVNGGRHNLLCVAKKAEAWPGSGRSRADYYRLTVVLSNADLIGGGRVPKQLIPERLRRVGAPASPVRVADEPHNTRPVHVSLRAPGGSAKRPINRGRKWAPDWGVRARRARWRTERGILSAAAAWCCDRCATRSRSSSVIRQRRSQNWN